MPVTRNNHYDWNAVFALADACHGPLGLSLPDADAAERVARAGWYASHTKGREGKWTLQRRGTDVYVRRAA